MDAVVECVIEYVGNPPFTMFRWQKSQQRLVTDGTKYTSRLIGNRMVLTVVNATTDDEGYYQCILETLVSQRRKASVFLSVNLIDATYAKLNEGVPHISSYSCTAHSYVRIYSNLNWSPKIMSGYCMYT